MFTYRTKRTLCGLRAKITAPSPKLLFSGLPILLPLVFVNLVSVGKFPFKVSRNWQAWNSWIHKLSIPDKHQSGAQWYTLPAMYPEKFISWRVCLLHESPRTIHPNDILWLEKSRYVNISLHSIHLYHKIHNIYSQQNLNSIATP